MVLRLCGSCLASADQTTVKLSGHLIPDTDSDLKLSLTITICIRASAVTNETKNTLLPIESNFLLLFNCNSVQNNIMYFYL